MMGVYQLHADMCKTFSNPTRLEILNLLREGATTVGKLVEKTGLGQANVSQHLSVMKSKGIVLSERKGKNVYYRLSTPKITKAFDIIREILSERLKESKKLAESL